MSFLNENGVNTRFLRQTEEYQGNAFIQVNEQGENCIVLYGGSNQSITEEQIRETLACFAAGDWLLLQNEINMNERIVDQAYARGMNIVLNPSPYNEKIARIDFTKLSWLFVNEIEAEQLFGINDIEETRRRLQEKYPRLNLLVTLGEQGSAGFAGNEAVRQDAFSAEAADTTGAGDTYTGYMISMLSAGKSLKECMETAGMAAALSVERPGAAQSIPYMKEVKERLGRQQNRDSRACIMEYCRKGM